MTKEEHEKFMNEVIAKVAKAYNAMENERDRAAIFILNNFEKVLSLFTERNSERSENGLYYLRLEFWMAEEKNKGDGQ